MSWAPPCGLLPHSAAAALLEVTADPPRARTHPLTRPGSPSVSQSRPQALSLLPPPRLDFPGAVPGPLPFSAHPRLPRGHPTPCQLGWGDACHICWTQGCAEHPHPTLVITPCAARLGPLSCAPLPPSFPTSLVQGLHKTSLPRAPGLKGFSWNVNPITTSSGQSQSCPHPRPLEFWRNAVCCHPLPS